MLGNHRDAWVFGAADASSGTAAMMERSRVLGEQLKTTLKILHCTCFTLSRCTALCPIVTQDLS